MSLLMYVNCKVDESFSFESQNLRGFKPLGEDKAYLSMVQRPRAPKEGRGKRRNQLAKGRAMRQTRNSEHPPPPPIDGDVWLSLSLSLSLFLEEG